MNAKIDTTPSEFTTDDFLRHFGPLELLPEGFVGNWTLTVDGNDVPVTQYAVFRSPGLKYGGMGMGLVRNPITKGSYMGTSWREHGGGGVCGALWSVVKNNAGKKELVIHRVKQIRERMTEAKYTVAGKHFVVPREESAPFRGFIDSEKVAVELAWLMEASEEVRLTSEAIEQFVILDLGSWNMNSAIIITHGENEGLTITGAVVKPDHLVQTEPGVWKFDEGLLLPEQQESLGQIGGVENEKILESSFVPIDRYLAQSRDITAPAVVGLILNYLFKTNQAKLVLN